MAGKVGARSPVFTPIDLTVGPEDFSDSSLGDETEYLQQQSTGIYFLYSILLSRQLQTPDWSDVRFNRFRSITGPLSMALSRRSNAMQQGERSDSNYCTLPQDPRVGGPQRSHSISWGLVGTIHSKSAKIFDKEMQYKSGNCITDLVG